MNRTGHHIIKKIWQIKIYFINKFKCTKKNIVKKNKLVLQFNSHLKNNMELSFNLNLIVKKKFKIKLKFIKKFNIIIYNENIKG